MKYIITEDQFEKLNQEDDILDIDFKLFNHNWILLQKFLYRRGNPPYRIIGNLDLYEANIESLGSLIHVRGWLNLHSANINTLGDLRSVGGDLVMEHSNIKSLGNLESVGGSLNLNNANVESLGNLESVGGDLDLYNSNIKSLGNLKSVRGWLDLQYTPLWVKYKEEDIRQMVDVKEAILI
jgi:hypothetical protein